jgi:LysM repeat protein
MRRFALLVLALFLCLAAVPTPAVAQDGVRHVVQPGETLFRIALRYGISVDALASANNISNRALVYVGQVLIIPSAAAAPAPQQPAPAQPAAPTNGTYTVQRGDTLNKIARTFGITLQQLLSVNGITDPNRISVGQVLTIPSGNAPAPQPPVVQNPPAQNPPAAPAAPAASRTHVVRRGESLAAIGRQYGVSVTALINANGLANPNLIYAGMVLRVPNAGEEPAPAPVVAPAAPANSGKLILVVLREQRVYVYNNGQLVRTMAASTGLPRTPTVQGQYKIYVKYRAQTMSGPGYYLPNVPYVMYFYQGYGLHGTYWHNNFGRPMSHGCVNLPTPEAGWLYAFAEVGTPVHVRW